MTTAARGGAPPSFTLATAGGRSALLGTAFARRRQPAGGPPPVFLGARFAAFLAVFLAGDLAAFFAVRLRGVAGPLARRSASSSAALSMVTSSTESPLRKLALDSPSVT